MKLGILQGRLSEPVDGKMQEFPIMTWKDEFSYCNALDITGIEWIITDGSAYTNPFFFAELSEKSILSVCVDTMVNYDFYKKEFMEKKLIPVLKKMSDHRINKIVVPLLEKSNIIDTSIRREFKKNVIEISKNYPDISFCFEFECDKEICWDLINDIDNFFITYDTGNFTSHYGKNVSHSDLIDFFGKKIKNVHLKDRTFFGETKPFGFGDTDFYSIIDSLKKINYNENIILQLSRQETGKEFEYIKNTINKINALI